MIDLFKELWFKWRARVYTEKVRKGSIKRLALKEQQLLDKAKAAEYIVKYKQVSRLS